MNEVEQSEIMDRFLDELDYPVSKPTLLAEAREAALVDALATALERLPDREYEDKQDVVRELNAA